MRLFLFHIVLLSSHIISNQDVYNCIFWFIFFGTPLAEERGESQSLALTRRHISTPDITDTTRVAITDA